MMTKFNKIIKFLLKWNELWTLPLALILFYYSPAIILLFDSEAAVYDFGIFQIILFAIIQFFCYTFIAWVYIKMTFPKAYDMLDDLFISQNIKDLTQWQKSKLVLVLFLSILFALVLLARTI